MHQFGILSKNLKKESIGTVIACQALFCHREFNRWGFIPAIFELK